jgi:hypothetical protein
MISLVKEFISDLELAVQRADMMATYDNGYMRKGKTHSGWKPMCSQNLKSDEGTFCLARSRRICARHRTDALRDPGVDRQVFQSQPHTNNLGLVLLVHKRRQTI